MMGVAMITIAPELQGIVSLGVLELDGAKVVPSDDRLNVSIAETIARIRRDDTLEHLLQPTRVMYRALGIDPTKTRPSSEALLRRVRKGADWPRINTLVDTCNWCSLELQLPYGLYDRAGVRGAVTLRLGQAGEEYRGIRKSVVHVGGRPTLVDDLGPFGNPTADSERTMVTTDTQSVLVVIFAPREGDPIRVSEVLERTSQRIGAFTGAHEIGRMVE